MEVMPAKGQSACVRLHWATRIMIGKHLFSSLSLGNQPGRQGRVCHRGEGRGNTTQTAKTNANALSKQTPTPMGAPMRRTSSGTDLRVWSSPPSQLQSTSLVAVSAANRGLAGCSVADGVSYSLNSPS